MPEEEESLFKKWIIASRKFSLWLDLPEILSLIEESRTWTIAASKDIVNDKHGEESSDRKLLATLFLSMSPNSNAENLFAAQLVLFQTLASGLWKEEAAECLAALIEAQWRRVTATPALLCMPRMTVPEILEACDDSSVGNKKSARILLAAQNAVFTTPSRGFIEFLRIHAG